MHTDRIQAAIQESIDLKQALLADAALQELLLKTITHCVEVFRAGGKVLFCGNGGSAADALHLSAELSGRYYFDRPPLFAEALHANSAFVTAVANDYDYDTIFARMLQASGRKGDVLVALSTSGNSPNVLRAVKLAPDLGITTIAFTGQGGGKIGPLADFWFPMPSTDTPRIQEAYMLIGHLLCEGIEERMFERKLE